ncbi:MAG TPA: hypothetical protein VF939_06030 [Puia sp.]
MRSSIFTALLLTFISLNTYSQKKDIIPVIKGSYEMGLQICYDSTTSEISGSLSFDNADEGPGRVRISCDLFFTGHHLASDPLNDYSIESRYPDDTTGETSSSGIIRIKKQEVFIQIKEPFSCQNLIDLRQGWSFNLVKRTDFIACRTIKAAKAFFYTQPNDSSQQKAYLINGDVVFIRGIKDGWLNVAYINKKGTRNGWMKAALARPTAPPAKR